MIKEPLYDKTGQQIVASDGVLYVVNNSNPLAIKSVTLTPNPVAAGATVLIKVEISENTWEQVKKNFANWNEVKTTNETWDDIYFII